MAKDYDKILTRLIITLSKLSNDEKPTLNELAEEFNVSLKTIQRDIYQRLVLFPIEKNDLGQLVFSKGYTLNQSHFSLDEKITLGMSIEQIKNAGSEFDEHANSVTQKVLSKNFFNPYYIKPQSFQNLDMNSDLLNVIEDSIKDRKLLEVYVTKDKLKLFPLKIMNFDGIWYLVSKNRMDDSLYTLLISDIKAVKVLHESLMNFDVSILDDIYTPFYESSEEFEVIIKVSNSISQYFKLKKHLPSQQILETYEDKSILVSFCVSSDEEVDNLIKSWLPDITIVKPERLKKQIIRELTQYIHNESI